MISSKTKYGLHALFYLAREYGSGPVLIAELAKKEKIPKKFLEAILLQLKNRGLLQSKKGKGGGYILGKDPNKIKMGEVIRILEGPLAPVPCVSQTAYQKCTECKNENTCEIRSVMKDVREAIAHILDNTSLADAILRVQNFSAGMSSIYHI